MSMHPSLCNYLFIFCIGGFKSFDILITQDGDVIYKLRLRGMINIPVHLNLEYIDASDDAGNNPARQSKITSISYNSTDTISHIEFKSQVPFQKFRVGVSMVNGFDEGPMNMTDTVFGKIRERGVGGREGSGRKRGGGWKRREWAEERGVGGSR